MRVVCQTKYGRWVADTDEITVIYWWGKKIESVWVRGSEFSVTESGDIKNVYIMPDNIFNQLSSLAGFAAWEYLYETVPTLTTLKLADFKPKHARDFRGLHGWKSIPI